MNASIVPPAEPWWRGKSASSPSFRPPSAELAFGEVVGWCDILPTPGEARRHVGVLGIGVIPGARHQGLGRRLTQAAIAKAWAKGMTRIELTVRADNLNPRRSTSAWDSRSRASSAGLSGSMAPYHNAYAMAPLREA